MIKKLRKKFITVSLLSVFALLTGILLVINMVNFALVTEDADRVLGRLVEEGGKFRDEGIPDVEPRGPRGPKGPDSPELGQTMRYFTVTFDTDGNVVDVNMKINAVSPEEAIEWARSLVNNKNGWSKTYYRYHVWNNGDNISVTVVDQSRELLPSYRVLIASCIGEIAGLLITLLALTCVSSSITQPVEQSDRKQKRFIRDASIELKDPIVAIDASRKTLENRFGETEETSLIAKEVERLTKVVQGLDTLLLLEEPHDRVRSEIDLTALISDKASIYCDTMQSAGKTMTLSLQEGVKAWADPVTIEKLIAIVLKNGADYAETRLAITLSRTGDRVVLELVNDATGLQDGPMDSVFERFYRSPEVRQSVPDGAGLGLSIAKAIVDSEGGRIRAEAKNGEFRLKIEL